MTENLRHKYKQVKGYILDLEAQYDADTDLIRRLADALPEYGDLWREAIARVGESGK